MKEYFSLEDEEDRTLAVSLPMLQHSREIERPQPQERDVIGEAARELRAKRANLSDEAWVKRVLQEYQEGMSPPEGYVWNQNLQEEMASVPPEGRQYQRREDQPPPPLFDEVDQMVIPKRVYTGGLVWDVGTMVGKGAFGKVFEIRHLGGEQRPRLVKFLSINELLEDAQEERKAFWSETVATMAVGDYVQDETLYDEQGNVWTAIILERHEGKTLADVLKEGRENPEEQEKRGRPAWAYKQAMALRSILSVLRRMHAQGWTHRDIKPANIVVNLTDGEESLSRPIDFGSAQKQGVIRRKHTGLFAGSPNYSMPEVWSEQDVDMRIEDYWACVLSVGMTLGVFELPKGRSLNQIKKLLKAGEFIQVPDLGSPRQADDYFQERKIVGPHRAFIEWLYQFIQPHKAISARQEFWRLSGITQTLEIPPVDSASLMYLPGEEAFVRTDGDFLDDDRFVQELEEHIRALADQAGIEMPDGVLENLQEFPAEQKAEERILRA